jgi:hypothetical protein
MRAGILRYEDKEVHGQLVRVAICAPGNGEDPPNHDFNRKLPAHPGAGPNPRRRHGFGFSVWKNVLDGAKWRRDSR